MAAICTQIELESSAAVTSELPGRLKELRAAFERTVLLMDAALRSIPYGGMDQEGPPSLSAALARHVSIP
jgi:hypothetical protein